MARCPICGNNGEDLIFKFYCSNNNCQNYNQSCKLKSITTDITTMLSQMWKQFREEETEEEFLIKFFANGGRFSFNSEKEIEVSYPRWLKARMNS